LYELSEDINIIRGVRQEDPLLPVLFLIVLEPLMLLLEESGKGYDMNDENECIPIGVYADDMVLHTNTNEDRTEQKFTF
jgi:hypothetical protein